MSRRVFEHALIVGKFYPPHAGHEYLVRTALFHSRSVTVLVLASSQESIPMQLRAAWLSECFPGEPGLRVVSALDDVPVDYQSARIWQAHEDVMRGALSRADASSNERPVPVDVVFSSEPYGEELARRFGARHVCLDVKRSHFPISGSQARAELAEAWPFLPPSVQAGLSCRVVILGAESSGTTTLARELCLALRARGGVWQRTECVLEYGREYSANLLAVLRASHPAATPFDLDWQEADFIHVSREQTRREELLARRGSPVLVCDTDAFATCIWHERYRGCASPTLLALADELPPRALYVLTDHHEVSFEDDGLRDGEALRGWMTERFAEALDQLGVAWLRVGGPRSVRVAAALARIDEVSRRKFTFAAPLPENA